MNKSFENSVTFWNQEPNGVIDQRIREYICEAFISQKTRLPQFILDNKSTMKLAKHLLFHRTGSNSTLCHYSESVYHFCSFLHETPDKLVEQCLDNDGFPNPKAVLALTHSLEDYMDYLRCKKLTPGSIRTRIIGLKSFFSINDIRITFSFTLSARSIYEIRAVTPEELQELIALSGLREKVIISMLATSGLRVGTLVKLRYRNIKRDLERNVVPALITVEAEITKGKYHSYYTYLNEEAVEYLKAYLKVREMGTRKILPERICDESPIIRARVKEIRLVHSYVIQRVIRNLFTEAGLINPKLKSKRYDVTGTSLRKYFKTQLTSAGVLADYTEFMMGHKISSYHDVKMKGTDFLRGVYLSAGLRVQPRIQLNKIDALKEIMVSWGLDPEKLLTQEAFRQPHDDTSKEKINNLLIGNPNQKH